MRFVDLGIVLVIATVVLWGVSAAVPHIHDFIDELSAFYILD